MANARFETTFSFSRHKANCRVLCQACGHEIIVAPCAFSDVFPIPVTIKEAERRLRCTACGEKRARLIPIPMPIR
ncbi:hypothetical protein [Sphingosinicella sp. BN140058]|uniref:hypothetical protein n=1 Tax=Sphingosinicella sp. BN140058 TaxID=1892855 RepID=UPI001012CD04|nr:hypothetical protein [Sphingosinicella sp. BN140058]QAY77940.1 hypothetical protein ETR14_16470 [Sphingosinicella sp. BN140058]